MKKAKAWEEEEGLEKLRKYCAWQERCRSEAWTKLSLLGCPRADMERLLDQLVYESFLDEGRFARSYARGKFSQKSWGKVKIRAALQGKRVADSLITEALDLIDEVAYAQTAAALVEKRIGGDDIRDWEVLQKLRAYMESKGYEWNAIEMAIEDVQAGN
jgi:regulatory protein